MIRDYCMAMRILANIEGISIIKFDERDIVRHKLVKRIVRAYENEENETDKLKMIITTLCETLCSSVDLLCVIS